MFYSSVTLTILMLITGPSINRWTAYFLISSISGFLLLISLRWVAINFVMLKYFIPVWLTFWLGLFSVDIRSMQKKIKYVVFILSILVTIGASQSLVYMYDFGLYKDISYADLKEIKSTKRRCFIGDYWYSYVLGIANPATIRATPHDQQFARNKAMMREVLKADTVIIVKNDWMGAEPDSLVQFEHLLAKIGSGWKEGKFEFVAYQNLGAFK